MRRFTLPAIAALAVACAGGDPAPGGREDALSSQQKVWTRLHAAPSAVGKLRARLAESGLDVTGSHHRRGWVDVLSTTAERDRIAEAHAELIRAVEDLRLPQRSRALSDYHDPDEIEALLDAIQASHPDIARKVLLAEGLPEGGRIWAMKISDRVELDEDEPTYLMDGQIHAREVMTAEVMIDAIEQLTGLYATDPEVRRWVDQLEIWIVPVVNPDGATYVHTHDPMWRKNRSAECATAIGVDLNRNFAWNYRACPGSDDACWGETYHGPAAASEIETRTMQSLMEALKPMYYINYHSYGEYILWSSGCGRVDEDALLREVGSALNAIVPTDDGQVGHWTVGASGEVFYTAPGGADDHAYGANGAVAFTIELNASAFHPDYRTWRDATCRRQRQAWRYLLARTLDGPSVRGHTFDAQTGQPVEARYRFADHPFRSGQWELRTDAGGRFGRALLPHSAHSLVFTAAGYLPEVREAQVSQGPTDLEIPMHAGTNHSPLADAGADRTVDEGDDVALNGSASSDPDGGALFFSWVQTAGPPVQIQQALTDRPVFVACGVDADSDLVFELTVSDGELRAGDSVSIRVRDMWDERIDMSSLDTPISIPDAQQSGIQSVIHVAEDRRVIGTSVRLDIVHPCASDLVVSLRSPAGTEALLHDREGGTLTGGVHEDYALPDFTGQMSGGDWRLHVRDVAGGDAGRLDSWALSLALQGAPLCSTPADCDLAHVQHHRCVDGRCEIDTCMPGWADCNALARDGCESDPDTDPANCGGCGRPCDYAYAEGICEDGACSMGDCKAGYADCNALSADGCEARLADDPENCGECGRRCSFAHAQAVCRQSSCRLGTCEPGWGNCDAESESGCETDISHDPQHCGACRQACDLPNATADCVEGSCSVVSCHAGFGDCDRASYNGCERDLESDLDHCGSCGERCRGPHAESVCEGGQCLLTACTDEHEDCNLDPADGCETDPASDLQHCGGCGQSCSFPGGVASCRDRICELVGCQAGRADCNGTSNDGCETDLRSDTENCGHCGQRCEPPRAEAVCEQGRCGVASCAAGWGDCNLDPDDGCETDLLSSSRHCGGCGRICPRGIACSDGTCSAICPDADGDGYFDRACGGEDCDDSDARVHPGSEEVCNGRDDDCNGLVDDAADCERAGGCACSGPGRVQIGWISLGLLCLLALRRRS
ncbi:MAG: proprotein convertase P-domain-containing protein [Deltaproteobacteria bacterium]|nr:proprotein convertase P-domain-containing protein [Deltaproteobacteria bacterium]